MGFKCVSIVMTSSAPWNPNSSSFAAMEEMYKVSSMNSHQYKVFSMNSHKGDANFITNMNLPCMLAAINPFNTAFHDTLTLKLRHGQDDLHNGLCLHLEIQETTP